MKSYLALLVLLSLAYSDDRLRVDVYIESQCPDCIRFVQTSLAEALNTADIENIVHVRLLAYGNARQTQLADGSWSFSCQHGSSECYGNLMETCGQSKLAGEREKLEFVFCLEDYVYFQGNGVGSWDVAGKYCSQKLGISF